MFCFQLELTVRGRVGGSLCVVSISLLLAMSEFSRDRPLVNLDGELVNLRNDQSELPGTCFAAGFLMYEYFMSYSFLF